ncbi:YbeD family protein [Marinobacter sp. M1N3S26]|uniref:HP0495 family protein n=1 Tax=unclassified Marinobacter TaxID=83889 RepID=UPI00387B6C62
MSQPKAPKIEFPCDYVIKVIGHAAPDFTDYVVSVVEAHAPGIREEHISVTDSRNGRFTSVQLTIVATGEPQLKALFEDLKASGRVHMVL